MEENKAVEKQLGDKERVQSALESPDVQALLKAMLPEAGTPCSTQASTPVVSRVSPERKRDRKLHAKRLEYYETPAKLQMDTASSS